SSSKRPISTFSSYNTSTLSKNSLTTLSCFVLIDSHFLTIMSCTVISVGILSNLPVFLFFFLTSTVVVSVESDTIALNKSYFSSIVPTRVTALTIEMIEKLAYLYVISFSHLCFIDALIYGFVILFNFLFF